MIEFKIPNGTMKINADIFFREASRAKIRKLLKYYKTSGPDPEAVLELKDWLSEQRRAAEDKASIYAKRYVDYRTQLSEQEEKYRQVKNPCYAAYTKDKELLAEAKKAISECKRRVTASGREAKRAKRAMERYEYVLERVETMFL